MPVLQARYLRAGWKNRIYHLNLVLPSTEDKNTLQFCLQNLYKI